MTHTYIPTTPPPNRLRCRCGRKHCAVCRPVGTHRAESSGTSSQAKCPSFDTARLAVSCRPCPDNNCPRHRPENYAATMARHATDSL